MIVCLHLLYAFSLKAVSPLFPVFILSACLSPSPVINKCLFILLSVWIPEFPVRRLSVHYLHLFLLEPVFFLLPVYQPQTSLSVCLPVCLTTLYLCVASNCPADFLVVCRKNNHSYDFFYRRYVWHLPLCRYSLIFCQFVIFLSDYSKRCLPINFYSSFL